MRIIHTSDWHAGKRLNRESRLPDLNYALEQMADFAKSEKVEFIILAGDVFDSVNPSFEAQEIVFEFFRKMHREGRKSIIVGGNHDSIGLFKSLKGLMSLASCYIFEKPQLIEPLKLQSNDNQILVVYPLPYPHQSFMFRLERDTDEREQIKTYREKLKNMLVSISEKISSEKSGFKVLLSHLMVDNAKISGSERPVSVLNTYSISQDILSPYFDYIALGHIHRPQKINNSKEIDIRYSGSPYQLNFGEEEDKSFVFIDIENSGKARIENIQLTLKRPLKVFQMNEKNIEEVMNSAKRFQGLIKFEIFLNNPVAGLYERIRREVSNTVFINTHFSNDESKKNWERTEFDPRDVSSVYREYYQSVNKRLPPPKNEEMIKRFLKEIEMNESLL